MKNMNEDCWLEFVWISLDFFYKFLYDEGSEENVVRQVVADEHLQTQHITGLAPTQTGADDHCSIKPRRNSSRKEGNALSLSLWHQI